MFTFPETYQLPPEGLDAPEAVSEAATAAREAGQRQAQAAAELAAAQAAVDQADAADQAAAQAAVAANKPVPAAKAGDKAREAYAAAQRKAGAAEADYREKALALTDLIIENRDEWRADLKARLTALTDEMAATFARLRELRADLSSVAEVEKDLDHFTAASRPGKRHNVWAGTMFGQRRRPPKPPEDIRRELEQRRLSFSIADDGVGIDQALVELEMLVTGCGP